MAELHMRPILLEITGPRDPNIPAWEATSLCMCSQDERQKCRLAD